MADSSDIPIDSAAGRLLALLRRATNISNGTIAHAFANIFEIEDEKSQAELLQAQAKAVMLIDEAELQISQIAPHFLTLFRTHKARLANIFICLPDANPWEPYKAQRIKAEDVTGLEYCATVLAKNTICRDFSKKELAELKQEIEALYNCVLNSASIDPALRSILLEGIHQLLVAIHDYNIRGGVPIEAAIGAIAQAVAQHEAELDSVEGFWDKFFKVVTRGSSTLALLERAQPFLEKAKPMLRESLHRSAVHSLTEYSCRQG